MKKALSMILCVLLLASCLALYAFAAEDTTAAEDSTAAETVERTNDKIIFDADLAIKPSCFMGLNGLVKGSGVSKTGEWEGFKIEIKNSTDPNFAFNYQTYCNKFDLTPLTGEEAPYIVLKFFVPEGYYYNDFEIYHCAGDVTAPTEEAKATSEYCDEANGFVYFIYNLEGMWSGNISQLRIDPVGVEDGDLFYLMELAIFKSEDEAIAWCDFDEEETETETETAEETTEEKTEEDSTKKPTASKPTDKNEKGCGSVIGTGLMALSLIALGAVCTKKKD